MKPEVRLRTGKGIAFPDSRLTVTALGEEDEMALAFALEQADAVGVSFVNGVADVERVGERVRAADKAGFGMIDFSTEAGQAFWSGLVGRAVASGFSGFKLDYETPLFGPPWSVPMEFPVYQWITATTSRTLGTSLEGTARGVSLFFFLATMPAVYGLAGFFRLAPSRRLLVVSAVLVSPTYLFYGRSFMIETTALCGAMWFLFTLTRAVRINHRTIRRILPGWFFLW